MKKGNLNTKEKILETVSMLFHNHGYQTTGINEIVKESGVVKSSLYHHFSSKQDMAVAYLEQRQNQWFQRVTEYVDSVDLIENKVLAVFDFLKHKNKEENFAGCSFLKLQCEASPKDVGVLKIIQKFKTDQRNFFIKLLEPTAANADAIYLLFEGALTASYFFRSNAPVDSAKSLIHLFLNNCGDTHEPINHLNK